MPDTDELETIGAFARRAGLTPSALRFYDECGLLVPAVVDPGSGYRRYAGEQLERAVLLRRVREAQLPLSQAPAVLDGERAEALEVLRAHLRRTAQEQDPARRAAIALLQDLAALGSGRGPRTSVLLAGVDLAAAVRQVAPFAAPWPDERDDASRALGCVRVEVAAGEVALVATDRLRMSVRTLAPTEVLGPGAAVCVPADELVEVAAWAWARHEVSVSVAGDGEVVGLAAEDEERSVRVEPVPYPDWRAVLGRVGRSRTRAVLDRRALLDEVSPDDPRPVVLDVLPRPGRVTVTRPGGRPVGLAATCTGAPVVVALDPRLLAAALGAAVGPDVVLELADPQRAVVVRSADAGTATTLVMPLGPVAAEGDEPARAPGGPGTGGGPGPVQGRR